MEVSTTLLPHSIASLISTVSLGARVSLRTAAIIVETLLETLQHGTSATLGISRRSLLAAISSAKILHVLKGSAGPNDAFSALLDKYTNLGVYVIHHSFTLAELFAIAGLQLASNTITVGIKAAEESVRIVDGLFGSTETSRALAAVVGLVRKEICDDDDFALARAGKMTILAAITKALTVFACLQAATHKRTQKSIRMQLLYEGVVAARPRKNHLLSIAGHTVDMRNGENHTHDLSNSSVNGFYYDHSGEEGDEEDTEEDDPELLKDLSNVLGTDPVDVTQDMTTTQIERVLSADILQVTTTQTLTTTTTQTFVRPGADLSLLGKPLPAIRDEGDTLGRNSFQGTLETTSSTRGATSSLSIRARSRRGSVSSIASVATTLTQYATTSIAHIPSMTSNEDNDNSNASHQHHRTSSTVREYTPTSNTITADANRQASNNLRLMFTTVTRKLKKNQKLQTNSEASGPHVFVRTQEREVRTCEGAESLEWSEDDTDWIEVTKSTETSTHAIDSISYDVPYDPQLQMNGGTSKSSNGFKFVNGEGSSRNFGKALLSKMGMQPSFLKNGRKSTRQHHQQNSVPQMTITEVDESKNDSSSSLGKESTFVNGSAKKTPPIPAKDFSASPPPLPPKEPKEPHPENFPRDHIVRNIQRFMRYASASYGHNFMRILGIGIIGDTVYSPYGDHPNHHAFAAHTNIPLDSILLSSFTDPANKAFNTPKMHSLVHYLNLDHKAKCVVLTCRGTLGLSDVLTDLCAHYDDLILPALNPEGKGDDDAFRPGAKYQVHAGMHASARLLANDGSTVFKTIKKALEEHPDYGLVLCGHSLGAGVVGILAVLLSMLRKDFEAYLSRYDDIETDDEAGDIGDGRKMYRTSGRSGKRRLVYPELTTPFVTSVGSGLPPGRPIHCYAFASPCVMSLPLSRYCRGLVTTVVYQYDIVPTLSLGLLKDFKNVAVTLYEEGQVVDDIVKRLVMGITSKEKRNNDTPHMSTADYMASTTYTSSQGKTRVSTTAKTTTMNGSQSTSINTHLYSEYDRWQLQEAEDQDWSWSLIKTMRADMRSEKLYPPSPVYLIESIATTIPADAAVPNGTMSTALTTAPSPIHPPPSPRTSASLEMSPSYSLSGPSLDTPSPPPPRSLTSMAFSTATYAAASVASRLSPFPRNTTPTPTPTTGLSEAEKKTKRQSTQQPSPQQQGQANRTPKKKAAAGMNGTTKPGPKKAYKVTMRRLDHVEDRFSEIQFARTMFTDHSPANYEDCVERLVQTVFGAA